MLYDYTRQQMEAMDAARKRGRTLAMDSKLPPYKRLARDEETTGSEEEKRTPGYNPSTLGGTDADKPVTLDSEATQKLLDFLKGKLSADDLTEVAQFLSEMTDTGAEATDEPPAFPGKPKVGGGAQDARHRQSFDERFPELKRIRIL